MSILSKNQELRDAILADDTLDHLTYVRLMREVDAIIEIMGRFKAQRLRPPQAPQAHPRPYCVQHGLPQGEDGQCQNCIDGKAPGNADENYRAK